MRRQRHYVFVLIDKRTLKQVPGVSSRTDDVSSIQKLNLDYTSSKLPIGWVECTNYYNCIDTGKKAVPAP